MSILDLGKIDRCLADLDKASHALNPVGSSGIAASDALCRLAAVFKQLRNEALLEQQNQRQLAIQAILKDAGVTDSPFAGDPEALQWAAALHDAGYRKVEPEDELGEGYL